MDLLRPHVFCRILLVGTGTSRSFLVGGISLPPFVIKRYSLRGRKNQREQSSRKAGLLFAILNPVPLSLSSVFEIHWCADLNVTC